eukprot:scaffold28291_cov63-Phaeocystis_antarctica.AAC.2
MAQVQSCVSSVLRAQCVACVSLNVLEKRGLIHMHKAAAHALAARNSQGEHNAQRRKGAVQRRAHPTPSCLPRNAPTQPPPSLGQLAVEATPAEVGAARAVAR